MVDRQPSFDASVVKELIEAARSKNNKIRSKSVSCIPDLITYALTRDDLNADQLILTIYNLNFKDSNFEFINLNNRDTIFKHLINHFTSNIKIITIAHMKSLLKIVGLTQSPEILMEVAYAIKEQKNMACIQLQELSRQIMDEIVEKATVNLYPDVLLMVKALEE